MNDRPVFARTRKEMLAVVLAAAGAAGALTACHSNNATYTPQQRPAATTQHSCGSTTQPAPRYAPPAATNPAPKPAGGQMACAKGKCG